MLAEHTFITTIELEPARDMTIRYLEYSGFRIESVEDCRLTAVRGKSKARSRRIEELPQKFHWEFDRGKITVVASVTPYQDKSLPLYSPWLVALVEGVQILLTGESDIPAAAEKFLMTEQNTRKIWFTSDKVVIGCLVVLLSFVVLLFVIVLLAAII